MATTKISALTELATAPDTGDKLVIVDVSDTTDAVTGTTKFIQAGNLGFISDLVDDTTPQLGGTLDANGNTIDMGVNVITDAKVATWDSALLPADIGATVQAYDANLTSFVGAFTLPVADSTSGYVLTTDGAGTLSLTAPAGGGGIGEFIDTSIAISSDDTALANDDGTANHNIGIGASAGAAITTGSNNVLLGREAGKTITTSNGTVAIGLYAGFETTGAANTFIGGQSGYYVTSGLNNVGIGYDACKGNSVSKGTGSYNIGVGPSSLGSFTTGTYNTAIGEFTLNETSTGSYNVALGFRAGRYVTTPNHNVCIGFQAGQGNSTSKATGAHNVSIGYNAGKVYTTAVRSTCVGYSAGSAITTGAENTFIGDAAGSTTTTGSNNTAIGNGATASSASVSNEITLGNSSVSTLRCQQTSITALSDARDKKDVVELDAGLDFINALNPVRFTWDSRDGGQVDVPDTGFIAQELQAAQALTGIEIPKLVYDVNPERLEASYGTLIPAMVKAIQELSDKVNQLEAQLNG